jgi:predicted ester cyclase
MPSCTGVSSGFSVGFDRTGSSALEVKDLRGRTCVVCHAPVDAIDQVRRFYDELWNGPDLSLVGALLHPDVTFRGSLGDTLVGHQAFAGYVRSVTDALGDYRCEIVDLVASPDIGADTGDGRKVAARMLFSGTHRGVFLGVPPTGARVSWAGAAFFTFSGPVVRDLWVLGDLASLRSQLSR